MILKALCRKSKAISYSMSADKVKLHSLVKARSQLSVYTRPKFLIPRRSFINILKTFSRQSNHSLPHISLALSWYKKIKNESSVFSNKYLMYLHIKGHFSVSIKRKKRIKYTFQINSFARSRLVFEYQWTSC